MISKLLALFGFVLGLALLAGPAEAAMLFTPPLVPDGDNELDCYLVNVSNRPAP